MTRLLPFLLLLCSCALPPQPEPTGALSQREAEAVAGVAASRYDARIIPFVDRDGLSMGATLTRHAYLVVADRWDRLEVGHTVLRRMPSGRTFAHTTVYTTGGGEWKTAGTQNSRHDPGWMTRDTYAGTVLLPIPFDPRLP